MQTKLESLREAAMNTACAFLLSVLSQRFIISPLQEAHYLAGGDLTDWIPAILITGYYTLLSVGRNYLIRRIGNRRQARRAVRGEG
ncbi:MAG: DUF7220 family protein [Pseudohongiellaceae bacterium]